MVSLQSALVTGCAGFIGFHVARALLERGRPVIGIDNLCPAYYPVALKRARLAELQGYSDFEFVEADLCRGVPDSVDRNRIEYLIHMAAHACVMDSFERPLDYVDTNVRGTQQVFDWARSCHQLRHLLYASSSSVYGVCPPGERLSEDRPLRPISPYGATKVANEAQAQAAYCSGALPVTGFRFFKVYGPWARPDTVFFKFADAISTGRPVEIYNHGEISHAFTYIDDILQALLKALDQAPPQGLPQHPVYNLGNEEALPLLGALERIETLLGRRTERLLQGARPGDRHYSRADTSRARRELGFANRTSLETGLAQFVSWYQAACVPTAQ